MTANDYVTLARELGLPRDVSLDGFRSVVGAMRQSIDHSTLSPSGKRSKAGERRKDAMLNEWFARETQRADASYAAWREYATENIRGASDTETPALDKR